MSLLIRILINGFAVYVAAYLLSGVQVRDLLTAVVVGIVLVIVNALVKPILLFLTLPITILTLGFFLIILNGILILFVSSMVPGFRVQNIFWAILFSLVLSVVNSFFQILSK